MPDNTDFRVPGKKFERKFGRKCRTPVDTKGGIIFPGKYKSFTVNIRPTKWQEKFWIGQIDNYVDAQFIADMVYYYIGRARVHFQNVNFNFPPLECKGTSTPLTSREMCSEYATSIAKGLKSQRTEFIKSVQKLAVEEVKRVEVQRVLQQFRNENVLAVIVGKHEEEDVQSPQSMEVDGPKHLPLVLASHEGITRNVDDSNAHVPGFDMGDPGFHLQSALTPVESSWVDVYLAGVEDYDVSPNDDAEDFGSATGVLEENYSCDYHSAMENIAVNFCVVEDTPVYETGERSSHFLINDREGESFVSDSHFTRRCMPDEFITRHFPCSDGATHYNVLDASSHPEVTHAWLREMEKPTFYVLDGW